MKSLKLTHPFVALGLQGILVLALSSGVYGGPTSERGVQGKEEASPQPAPSRPLSLLHPTHALELEEATLKRQTVSTSTQYSGSQRNYSVIRDHRGQTMIVSGSSTPVNLWHLHCPPAPSPTQLDLVASGAQASPVLTLGIGSQRQILSAPLARPAEEDLKKMEPGTQPVSDQVTPEVDLYRDFSFKERSYIDLTDLDLRAQRDKIAKTIQRLFSSTRVIRHLLLVERSDMFIIMKNYYTVRRTAHFDVIYSMYKDLKNEAGLNSDQDAFMKIVFSSPDPQQTLEAFQLYRLWGGKLQDELFQIGPDARSLLQTPKDNLADLYLNLALFQTHRNVRHVLPPQAQIRYSDLLLRTQSSEVAAPSVHRAQTLREQAVAESRPLSHIRSPVVSTATIEAVDTYEAPASQPAAPIARVSAEILPDQVAALLADIIKRIPRPTASSDRELNRGMTLSSLIDELSYELDFYLHQLSQYDGESVQLPLLEVLVRFIKQAHQLHWLVHSVNGGIPCLGDYSTKHWQDLLNCFWQLQQEQRAIFLEMQIPLSILRLDSTLHRPNM